jgi:hypothetical protein
MLAMAVMLLPTLPREVTCLLDEGGQIHVRLTEARDGHLHAELSLLDSREGLLFTIPVETPDRGGYAIGCEIVDSYFMGGLHSGAKLAITEITRRKPYRAKERASTDAVANLSVIAAKHFRPAQTLFARVIDVSASGVGLAAEQELAIGDRLRLQTSIEGIPLSADITVVAKSRIAFGRWRTGCRLHGLLPGTAHQLDALTTRNQAAA